MNCQGRGCPVRIKGLRIRREGGPGPSLNEMDAQIHSGGQRQSTITEKGVTISGSNIKRHKFMGKEKKIQGVKKEKQSQGKKGGCQEP